MDEPSQFAPDLTPAPVYHARVLLKVPAPDTFWSHCLHAAYSATTYKCFIAIGTLLNLIHLLGDMLLLGEIITRS